MSTSTGRNTAACAAACCLLWGCATARSVPPILPVRATDANVQVVTLPTASELTATGMAVPVPTVYSQVTASKLVSRPDLEFKLAELQWESYRVTFSQVARRGELVDDPIGIEGAPILFDAMACVGGVAPGQDLALLRLDRSKVNNPRNFGYPILLVED